MSATSCFKFAISFRASSATSTHSPESPLTISINGNRSVLYTENSADLLDHTTFGSFLPNLAQLLVDPFLPVVHFLAFWPLFFVVFGPNFTWKQIRETGQKSTVNYHKRFFLLNQILLIKKLETLFFKQVWFSVW